VTPALDLGALAPMIAVGCGVLLLPLVHVLLERTPALLGRPLTREARGTYLAVLTAFFLAAGLILTLASFGERREFDPASPLLSLDPVTAFLNTSVLIAALLTVLGSSKFLADVRANHGEYYTLILSSVTGMLFMTGAADLLLLFLSLELMSIPVYALVALRRDSMHAGEGALKYFLIGSFASALLLYGSALLYGATGSLDLREIGARFDPSQPLPLLGAGLLLVGLAFKIASVPFHQWVPDTYQGAPSTVTGFMATAVKVTAFGALARVLALALEPVEQTLYPVLWVLAAASMTVGNLMALLQDNVKRLLAYSSIAHAGYILVGVLVGGAEGLAAVLFYLLVYVFMTLGAFAVVAILARDGDERDRVDDLAGLIHSQPLAAITLALCAFSLLGLPGTAGFIGKLRLFGSAVERGLATGDTGLVVLVVVAVLNTAVSAVYYLRLPAVMFMSARAPGSPAASAPGSLERVVLWVCAAAILALGIVPHDLFIGGWPEVDVLALAELAAAALN
jgi:NADH-quinone oxidoreductase subunit N